jgi:hypothetical protein
MHEEKRGEGLEVRRKKVEGKKKRQQETALQVTAHI